MFLGFVAALATPDSRSALMCKCICTQQSTLEQQLGERDLGKNTCTNEYQENKHGPVHTRQKYLNEMLFSLRFLSHGCNFFVTTILVITKNLTVLWNNGDYSKAIKFLSVIYTCYIHSHPQYWWQMSEAKTSTNMKTTTLSITCAFRYIKHFSVQ